MPYTDPMLPLVALTNKNFDDYFAASKIIAIDFWAPWCIPCHDFSRVFSAVAETISAEEVCFASINVDEEKKLAQDFSIQSVPTIVIIRNQVVVFSQSGVMPKQALVDLIKQARDLPEEIKF